MPGPWVVLGCGRAKESRPAEAIAMYRGPFVACARLWARSVTDDERILVLSAKHGLIAARTVIEPYDVSFSAGPRDQIIARDALARQVAETGLTGPLITLAGREYQQRLSAASAGVIEPINPFERLVRDEGLSPGMGYQMQAMNAWHGRIPPLGAEPTESR